MQLSTFLLVIGAYLLGSFPSAYIAGRLIKGIDIREYGSGNVGGSNVWEMVSKWALFPVGITDVIKGMLPVYVAQRMGLGLPEQAMAGLAAIIGHNWSVFLKFDGGRGIATILGVLFLFAPTEMVILAGLMLVGFVFHHVALAAAIGLALLPLAAWIIGEPLAITLTCLLLLILVMSKRLLSNRGTGAEGEDWRSVMINRLLFDRDIRSREEWVHRTPDDRAEFRGKI